MEKSLEKIKEKLKSAGLKVTPQRIAVYKVLLENRNHPSVEFLISEIRKENPFIAVGTIYNILDTFVQKKLVERVMTTDNLVRYDAYTDNHFHLYSEDEKIIEDYYDEELFELIREHLSKSRIPGFEMEDFELLIKGNFKRKSKQKQNQGG